MIRQQLRRLAGIDRNVVVQAIGGDEGGLGWRTVVTFAIDRNGVAGLRRHRSHEVIEIDRCLIAHPLVTNAGITRARWPAVQSVAVSVAPATGERGALLAGKAGAASGLPALAADTVQLAAPSGKRIPVRGRGYLTQRAAGRDWRVSLGGFWQVHPGAADLLAAVVLAALRAEARRGSAGPVLRRWPIRGPAGRGGRPGWRGDRRGAGSGSRPGRPAQLA